MSQRPLLLFGCTLIFGLFALLAAGAPIARFELWLASLDSSASAQAACSRLEPQPKFSPPSRKRAPA